MTDLRLHSGQRVSVGSKLGEGGQGAVHHFNGRPESLVKLFHKPADARHHKKLVMMMQIKTPDLERVAAWPTDVVLDGQGRCVGFIMPKVQRGHEIDRLAHPAEQRRTFPTIDYGFLLHVAMNTARATAVVHANDCVVGDVNERNVLVLPDGTVRLIDADSFQVARNGEVFTCRVGSELFTPPELRGADFSTQARTPNHDGFGLAILIFQLLMLGRHPFAGVPRDGKARTIAESIHGGFYAYDNSPVVRVSPPPDALPMSSLGTLCPLFRRAFMTQQRPTASEWMDALDAEKGRMRRCNRNARHVILQSASTCPLCALKRDPLPVGLPKTTVPDLGGVSVAELLAQTSRVQPLQRLTDRCRQSPVTHRYIKPEPERSPVSQWGGVLFGLGTALAIFCPLAVEERAIAFGIGVICGLVGVAIGKSLDSDARERFAPLKKAAESALLALDSIEQRGQSEESAICMRMDPLWKSISQSREAIATAGMRLDKALREADQSWKTHKLEETLSGEMIRHAGISGIGASRSAVLASFGIETAADITEWEIRRVPGFGPELTRRLIEWRKSQERRFWAKGPGPTPTSWLDRIRNESQRDLNAAAIQLRRDAQEYMQRMPHDDRRLGEMAQAMDEARDRARKAIQAL